MHPQLTDRVAGAGRAGGGGARVPDSAACEPEARPTTGTSSWSRTCARRAATRSVRTTWISSSTCRTQAACEQVAAVLGAAAFTVDFRRVDPERGDRYTLHAFKSMRISVPDMQATTREFTALAAQHGGRYDGWATAGITRAAARRDDSDARQAPLALFGLAAHGFRGRLRRPARRRGSGCERAPSCASSSYSSGMPVGMFSSTICALRHSVEHLDQRAQAVAVRHDHDIAAGAQLRRDALLPEGQHARERVLQRLGGRQLLGRHLRVARIEARMARVVRAQRRRRHVVAAPPDLHLRGAVLRDGLRLVEALQRAVVALVEAPVALRPAATAARAPRGSATRCGSRA